MRRGERREGRGARRGRRRGRAGLGLPGVGCSPARRLPRNARGKRQLTDEGRAHRPEHQGPGGRPRGRRSRAVPKTTRASARSTEILTGRLRARQSSPAPREKREAAACPEQEEPCRYPQSRLRGGCGSGLPPPPGAQVPRFACAAGRWPYQAGAPRSLPAKAGTAPDSGNNGLHAVQESSPLIKTPALVCKTDF